MIGRRGLAILGFVAFALGITSMVEPELLTLRVDEGFVSLIGILALVQTLRFVQERRHGTVEYAETGDPELPTWTPAPGDDLARTLAGMTRSGIGWSRDRTQLRDRLADAAVRALTLAGSTEDTARERVRQGSWTDDAYAAAFIGQPDRPAPTLREQLRYVFGSGSEYRRDVHRTVDAIGRVAGVEFSTGDDPDDRRDTDEESADRNATQSRTPSPDRTADDEPANGGTEYHTTGVWRGVSATALGALAVGTITQQPAVMLAGIGGIGFSAYARATRSPDVGVAIERTVSDDHPQPGDDVTVTITVRNEGGGLLPDLRLIDGVPDDLAVVGESPRLGTALRPGQVATMSYTITAKRGVHSFGRVHVIARDITGSVEAERWIDAETTITCVPTLQACTVPVPLRERAVQFAGQMEIDDGGEGIEFHAVREYRPGDSIARIDWNRFAKTGTPATLEFRKERAATVVIVIDSRTAVYLSPEPYADHAFDRAVDAAGRLFTRLLDDGHSVGIAAFGPEEYWLPPGTGEQHRARVQRDLATHEAFSPMASDERFFASLNQQRLRRRLSPGAQIVFLTPLCEDYPTSVARQFDAHGYPTTIVSPDPTVTSTVGGRITRIERTLRIAELRRAGHHVIDWNWNDPFDVALARAAGRWSR